MQRGTGRIGKKVLEEAGEAVIAALEHQRDELTKEVADLWFHSLILLAQEGVEPEAVFTELRSRRK
jgi:phosphoribosyl-ATP pyrophosphohydrolase